MRCNRCSAEEACAGPALYLPGQLGALGQAGGAERVALGDEAARRVDDVLTAVRVLLLVNVLAGLADLAQAERLVGDEL